MKFTFLKTIAFCILFGMTSTALAGIIYDFDISSQNLNPAADFKNYTFVAEFSESTDFAAVTIGDILNFGYSYEGVDYLSSSFFSDDPSKLFTILGGQLRLVVGAIANNKNYYVYVENLSNGASAQVGRSGNTNLYITGEHARYAHNWNIFNSFAGVARTSIDVPEPSTFAIFALGMIGLASRRFKKKS